MTLTLATTPDLAPETRRLESDLRARGTVFSTLTSDAVTGGSPIERLYSDDAHVALVRAETLLDVPDDLRVVAVLPRDEPRDVLVPAGADALTLQTLPTGARVGVADGRRRGFLRAYRPDVQGVQPGNGEGPAGALRSASVDAVILGSVEARRLALRARASEILDPKAWLPGACQGTVLVLARADDESGVDACAPANDAVAHAAWLAESAVLSAQGVSGDAPIGVLAQPHGKWIRVWGMAVSDDGTRVVRGDVTGSVGDPGSAGRALAELLVARGVAQVLRRGRA